MDDDADVVGGRQRREKREDVRARLLATADRIFTERGYEGASLERVAAAAGFSKGAVYSNFANKDELFFELVAARIDERIEALRVSISVRSTKPRGGESRAAMAARAAGRELRIFGEADPEWQMLFIEFWLRCARSEALRSRLAVRRREMRERIAELVESKARVVGATIGHIEAMDLATTVLALSNGLGIEGIIDPEAAPPHLFGELLSRIVEGAPFVETEKGMAAPEAQRPTGKRRR